MTQPIGIDLGTTLSAVARLDAAGRTAMVLNSEGQTLTPSVVLFEDEAVTVGREALKACQTQADRVARWVKRDMGNPTFSQPLAGQHLPPEAIQACILRQLRNDIVREVGPDFRAVVTVPAFFDDTRRRATAEAAEMAGLPLADIVNEPTAAALAFGEKLGYLSGPGTTRQPLTVLVYDLGGGTFDVTVVRLEPGHIRTLATDGDVHLGGYDWDLRLADFAAEAFQRVYGADPRSDLKTRHALLAAAEEAKLALSARQRSSITIAHAGKRMDVPVTRAEFEDRTADLLRRTSHTARQTMTAAGLNWSQIDRVLLVGGATRMPMVTNMLRELTGRDPHGEVHPDEAVARGAALYAAHVLGAQGVAAPAVAVTNVSAHSLGVEGVDVKTSLRTNYIIIPRNAPLPARVTKKCVTRKPGQTSVHVNVLEGESTLPANCVRIGRAIVRPLPAGLPAGTAVKVTYEYDTSGRLNVLAQIPGTECQATLTLERTGARGAPQVARWREVIAGTPGLPSMTAAKAAEEQEQVLFAEIIDEALGLD
jgi:molecular chaperone DnaK